jgi:hypothetical protein
VAGGWVFNEQKMQYLIIFQTNPFFYEIGILMMPNV